MKSFTYLGYTVQKMGDRKFYIRERHRKGMAVIKQVWGMGKRRFGADWGKRIWLFDKLVWAVVRYGVEV